MSSAGFEVKSTVKCFGGYLTRFSHHSQETKTTMTCSVFVPSSTEVKNQFPYIKYLSGLTCTDENVCQKSGIFSHLAKYGLGLVAPDTSPRGAGVEGEDISWDFGTGAGFYLDATAAPWSENYRMYSYITSELPTVIANHFPALDGSRVSVTGHSMGGHGALTISLKNPTKYTSVSAFAPICNPMSCPWGKKAFSNYIGTDEAQWHQYDATSLMRQKAPTEKPSFDNILIDVGTADNFYTGGQLLCESFEGACAGVSQPVQVRYQDGYDHSYYFVSSFMGDHIEFHANYLNKK